MVDLVETPTGVVSFDTKAFEAKTKGRRSLEKTKRSQLAKSLQSYPDLKIVKGKPVLDRNFFAYFIKQYKLNEKTDNNHEKEYYRFFGKLKKYGLIHARSASFPKKLSIVSINPNIASLHRVSLRHIDTYVGAREQLLGNIDAMSIEEKRECTYIGLRLFVNQPLYPNELNRIRNTDVIFLNGKHAVIYIERDNILSLETKPYQLVFVDNRHVVRLLKEICAANNENANTALFFIDKHEDALQNFRKKHFCTLSISAIHMTGMNLMLLQTSPIRTTLLTARNGASPMTLSEIKALYPNSVPESLMKKEVQRVLQAMSRPEQEENILESESELFSIEQFEKLPAHLQSFFFVKSH